MDFLKYANDNKDNLLKDLSDIIKFKTELVEQPNNKMAPFGEAMVECLTSFLALAKKCGFKVGNIDNVAGYVEYDSDLGDDAKTIGVLGHLDVVPAGVEGWNSNPYEATIIGDKLYARGSADDKGPLMSAFYALKCLKDNNIKLNKKVRIIVGTDEENGSRGLARYLEKEPEPDVAFSPDADYPVIYGEKGIASFDFVGSKKDDNLVSFSSGDAYNVVPDKAVLVSKINLDDSFTKYAKDNKLAFSIETSDNTYTYTLRGKRAHAMEPKNGINALVHMAHFAEKHFNDDMISFVSKCLNCSRLTTIGLNFKDEEMGDFTCNVANFLLDGNKTKVGINIRYPKNFSYDKFYEDLSNIANGYNIDMVKLTNSEPHYIPKEDELVQTLYKSYQKFTNDYDTKPLTIGGGTYARHLKYAVAFGIALPGDEDVMHQVNEYVKVSNLVNSVAIIADAIYNLGK